MVSMYLTGTGNCFFFCCWCCIFFESFSSSSMICAVLYFATAFFRALVSQSTTSPIIMIDANRDGRRGTYPSPPPSRSCSSSTTCA